MASHDDVTAGDADAEPRPRPPRQKRWGLRTLGFLTIALVSLLTLGSDYALLSAVGVVIGLAGAGYCSYRGLKAFTWLPR